MPSINFLERREGRMTAAKYLFGLLLLSIVFLYIFVPSIAFAVVIAAAILFFAINIEMGFFLSLPIVFMHGLEIRLSDIELFSGIPILSDINAPLIDFYILLFSASLFVATVFGLYQLSMKKVFRLFPGLLWYGAFLLIAFLSSQRAYGGQIDASERFVIYPMLFVYVAYIVVPLAILQSRALVQTMMRWLFGVGVAIAGFGFIGFLRSMVIDGWPRAIPFGFFGIAPFGYNHNMIGEILVSLIPIGVYFSFLHQDKEKRELYQYGTIAMITVAMLTLSRSAWLVLGIDALLFGLFFYRSAVPFVKKIFAKIPSAVAIFLFILLCYMTLFLGSSVVSSSNDARWAMTEISLFYIKQNALFGVGPNMFIPVLQDTELFVSNFGDPLDAHGTIQKVFFEEGLLGGTLFFLFFMFLFKDLFVVAKKNQDLLLLTFFFVALSAFTFQLFSTSYFNANLWFPIGISFAALQLVRFGDRYALYEETEH